jgi:hypothetical protein
VVNPEALRTLKLSGMLETLDARLARAHGGDPSELDQHATPVLLDGLDMHLIQMWKEQTNAAGFLACQDTYTTRPAAAGKPDA